MSESVHKKYFSKALDFAIKPGDLVRIWKKDVRDELRIQPFIDLHDYLDIHRNIKDHADRIAFDIKNGNYKPGQAEFITIEKSNGISRRIPIPDPIDTLILQALVISIQKKLLSRQPTNKAYYSKSHKPKSYEDVDDSFPYPWWRLWPEFQDRILRFTKKYPFLIVTDIANYYDSIPLHFLRNTVSADIEINEYLLNFLFYILDNYSWKPFYSPATGVGLPQINLDAPRLLAHTYLFKLDELLNDKCSGDFVRWMDDIDIGVNSKEEAKHIIKDIDSLLHSLGLRLNGSKTKILESKEAVKMLHLNANQWLNVIKNIYDQNSDKDAYSRSLKKGYVKFRKSEKVGNWDKIQKRFFTEFGRIQDSYLEKDVKSYLHNSPSLRKSAVTYLFKLGYSKSRLQIILDFMVSKDSCDDSSLYIIASCLSLWNIPDNSIIMKRIIDATNELLKRDDDTSVHTLISCLSYLPKLLKEEELYALLIKYKNKWTKSAYASRNVAAILPALSNINQNKVIAHILKSGQINALSVVLSLDQIKKMEILDTQLSSYLFHYPKGVPTTPIQKALMFRNVLQGRLKNEHKKKLRNHLRLVCKDRCMIRMIRKKELANKR